MFPRRQFLKSALGAAVAVPPGKQITLTGAIPARPFGKTGHTLPVLACGGSALVEKWSAGYGVSPGSFAQRVAMVRHAYDKGIRYFDTSRNYMESESIYGEALRDVRQNLYLATKVGVKPDNAGFIAPNEVRASVEASLKALRTDYVDCIQIHGPAYEYMGCDHAMRIYEQLDKLRGEKLFRFVGVTGHTSFERMFQLVDTKLFDSVFLAYGYFPKGMDTLLSLANLQWRELVMSRARELGMGMLAMKVLSSFVLGHGAVKLVPDFDETKLAATRRAALRWALRDKQPPVLVVGVSQAGDIDCNVETLCGDLTLTAPDRRLLAEFSAKALASKTVAALKTT